jgi:hypothetical protein
MTFTYVPESHCDGWGAYHHLETYIIFIYIPESHCDGWDAYHHLETYISLIVVNQLFIENVSICMWNYSANICNKQ